MFLRKSLALCAALMVVAPMAQAQQFVAWLDGPSEAPANASPATGFASVIIDDVAHTMKVHAHFSGLLAGVTASHIHGPTTDAFTGTAGVATPTPSFPGFPSNVTSGSYDRLFDMTQLSSYRAGFVTANGGTAASAEAVLFGAIRDGKAYINIHTTRFPGGEIRGFFRPVPEPGTIAMLGAMGAGSLLMFRRRRK